MRKLKSLSAVLFLFAVSATAQHEIDVRFDPETHVLYGVQVIAWEETPAVAWFSLPANLDREPNPYLGGRAIDQRYAWGFDPAWTEIDAVSWVNGEDVTELEYALLPAAKTTQTYSLQDGLLRIDLPATPGKLKIEFRTRFPHLRYGEPGRIGRIYQWRFGWHPMPVLPADGEYWPHVMLAHDYHVRLALPEGWEAILPGTVERWEEEDLVIYGTTFGQPVRSVMLLFAPEGTYTSAVLPSRSVDIEVAALADHEDKLRAMGSYVEEILTYYGERYGPYPFERILLVEHPSQVGIAYAADGVACMPQWLFRRADLTAPGVMSRYGRFILAHELAHQWWGLGIGVDLDAENWLSEAFSHYLAVRWYEDRYGEEGGNVFKMERPGLGAAMVNSMIGFVNLREHLVELPYLSTVFLGFDEAIVKPTSEVDYLQASGVRLYEKGYLVLRALGGLVGEEALDEALQLAHERFRGAWLTVDAFQGLVEETSEQELSDFFDHWVWGDAWADYRVDRLVRARDGELHVTEAHVSRAGRGFLPVVVEARGAEGERARVVWGPDDPDEHVIVFETDFPVRRVSLDPDHHVLDVDRLNNHMPRRFVVAMERAELPLDAYLIEADPMTQGLSLRYLDRFGWEIHPQFQAAAAWIRYGREATLSGWAQVTDTLVGQVSFTRHLWSTPALGSTGTYWTHSGDLTLTVARMPTLAFELSAQWQDLIRRGEAFAGSLLYLSGYGGRVVGAALTETRLWPHTYLQFIARGGMADEGLPDPFKFRLSEFNSIGTSPIAPPAPIGRNTGSVTASLWLPEAEPDYMLGGIALVDQVLGRGYATAGKVWDEPGDWSTAPLYLEAGGELWIGLDALGGLMRLYLVLGAAWPISPSGPGVIYLGFGM